MRLPWLIAAVWASQAFAGTPVQLTPAQQQAIMDSGTQFGQGALSVEAGTINSTGGAAGVPSYNATPSGQAPGSAGLFGPATKKQTGCNGYTAPAGAGQVANQQDCDAVDFLTKHPNTKSAYPINAQTDPTIQAGKSVLNAARDGTAFQAGGVAAGGASTTATGSAGVTGTTTQTGCQAVTTTTPATTTTQTCYNAATSSAQTCTKTWNVTVTQTPPIAATATQTPGCGQCVANGRLVNSYQGLMFPMYCSWSYRGANSTISGYCFPIYHTTYSCPAGYTLNGTTCYSNTPVTVSSVLVDNCTILQAKTL